MLTPAYHGFTDTFTLVSASVGVCFHEGKLTTSLKVNSLLDDDIQQHVFEDILKRSVAAEVRVRF